MKKVHWFAYGIILASLILLVLNVLHLDFDNLANNSYSGIVSNILLILLMGMTIWNTKRINQ